MKNYTKIYTKTQQNVPFSAKKNSNGHFPQLSRKWMCNQIFTIELKSPPPPPRFKSIIYRIYRVMDCFYMYVFQHHGKIRICMYANRTTHMINTRLFSIIKKNWGRGRKIVFPPDACYPRYATA